MRFQNKRSCLFVSRAQLQLIVNEIVERNNSANKGTQIDGHKLVICLQIVRVYERRLCDIGQQVEHFLDVVDNSMIDWQCAACYLTQVAFNVGQLITKSA